MNDASSLTSLAEKLIKSLSIVADAYLIAFGAIFGGYGALVICVGIFGPLTIHHVHTRKE